MKKREFGLLDNLAYAAGDMGNCFTFSFVASFLFPFYVDILKISPATVAILFLTARIVDAFTDVGMGKIVDMKKHTKEGKFRYWILRVAPFVSVAGFLLFAHWIKDFPYTIKVIYIFVTYLFWGSICYTAINIPYGSMASVITDVPEQRASLSSYRTVGSMLAGAAINLSVPIIVFTQVDGRQVPIPERFTMVAFVFSILAFISYMFCYYGSVERIQTENTKQVEKRPLKQEVKIMFKSLATNKPLLAYVVYSIISVTAMFLIMSMNKYIYINYFNDKKAYSIAGVMLLAVTVLLMPTVPYITKRWGKKKPSAYAMLFSALIYGLTAIFQIKSASVYLIITFIGTLGYGYATLISWSFISDIIDAQEVKTHEREDGTIYALVSFARKLAQALVGAIQGYALIAIGYNQNLSVQTAEVSNNIYYFVAFAGAIGLALCFLAMYFLYPLDKEEIEKNSEILRQRKLANK